VYHQRAQTIVERYSQSLTDLQNAQNPAARLDAEGRFRMSVDQATSMFDAIHAGRRNAFSPVGEGYDDFGEYVWKAGKQHGWLGALRQIKQYHDEAQAQYQRQTYGVELPSADVLIRRAAMRYR
jgi:hypothetical protein